MSFISQHLSTLYREKAANKYGLSDILQKDHALQAAAMAEAESQPASLIVAALLHDVGHMIHDLGEDPASHGINDTHEALGASWLAQYFGPEVTEPVRLHVAAKRYLCAVEPDYVNQLAEDSIRSLALQGGVMSQNEVAAFEALPYAQDAVRLRRYDDLAKVPGVTTPSVDHFVQYIDQLMKA